MESQSTHRSRTLAGLMWSGMAQLVRLLLGFGISVILARLLTPTEFGLVGMILVFTGFAELFSNLGLGAALIQIKSIADRHLNVVFWTSLAAGIVLTLLLILFAPLLAAFYETPALTSLSIALAFNFILSSLGVVQLSLLSRALNFRSIALAEVSAVGIGGILGIGLALNGSGVWSLVAKTLMTTCLTTLLLWRLSPWRPSFHFDRSALRELWGFSANLVGFQITNYWARNLDDLLIGRLIGSAALGIYSRAYALMLLPLSQITRMLSRVMFPSLAEIQDHLEQVRGVYLAATRTIALLTFPLMVGLWVLADVFVLALLGEKWVEVTPILRILCISGLGQSVGSTTGWIYKSQGRTDIQLKWGLFSSLVRCVAFLIGIQWGIVGVAYAYVLSGYVILWYPAWAIPGRLIGLTFWQMLKNVSGPFGCAIVMGMVLWGGRLILPATWPQWITLLFFIIIGIVIYATVIHFIRIRAYVEGKMILQNFLENWRQPDQPATHKADESTS